MTRTLRDDLLKGGVEGEFYSFIRTKHLFEKEDEKVFYQVRGINRGENPLGWIALDMQFYDSEGNPVERDEGKNLKIGYDVRQLRHRLSDFNVSESFKPQPLVLDPSTLRPMEDNGPFGQPPYRTPPIYSGPEKKY